MEVENSLSLEELEENHVEEVVCREFPTTQCGLPNLSRSEIEVPTENSIVDVLKSKLEVGSIVNNLEEAYL
ncbi:hypothetical protein F511_21586 [Dorcoceras hygrometricum]|uniref:Uncharacterized protein n=1 Tax=Dorcoceras hygrometricum TaxID=472368 RepID=A0A2Z7DFV2_9LAMI|nr:hypothetical protein F511_21586 [Dorcoceras hygrometricum]